MTGGESGGRAQPSTQASSSYATGGGGVTFERLIAARYLALLLTGRGTGEIGDGRHVVAVDFQQAPAHAVDDLVIRAATDGEHDPSFVLSVGVRRAPNLVTSDEASRKLIRDFVVASQATVVEAGAEHALALVVAGQQTHPRELATLAGHARAQRTAAGFDELVRTPNAFRREIRDRLSQLEGLVRWALNDLGTVGVTDALVRERVWGVLSQLTVLMPRLESPDELDWQTVLDGLQTVARDETVTAAARVGDRLLALAAEYAPKAARVDLFILRRDAHAVLATGAARDQRGWVALQLLHDQALSFVDDTVRSGDGLRQVHLERADTRAALVALAQASTAVLVTGESGVGKSAMTVRGLVAHAAPKDGVEVLCLNLRDLPGSVLEFETALGKPLAVLLGQMSAPERFFVVDAADAANEGRAGLLRYLADAARLGDVRLVAVSAAESGAVVSAVLTKVVTEPLALFEVPGLSDGELTELADELPELAGLVSDSRSRVLIRRLVVLALLVRGGMTGVPVTEAEALRQVWAGLVRRGGVSDRGDPRLRELTLLRLADRAITPGDPLADDFDADAVSGLVHDGLLRRNALNPFQVRPEFAHDEIRRYAVASLLLNDEPPGLLGRLISAGAPRWTLAAARLACQAVLASPASPAWPVAGRLSRMQAVFDGMTGSGFGARWGDVPGEAVLGLADPQPLLRDAWPALLADDAAGLERLIRLLGQRHRTAVGLISPAAAEPVVTLLLDHDRPWRVSEGVTGLLRDWLIAHVVGRAPAGQELRLVLRDRLVVRCAEVDAAAAGTDPAVQWRDRIPWAITGEPVLEFLALLGPDIGDGEAVLHRTARDAPGYLAPAVEEPFTGAGLAQARRGLLAELTEAYYRNDKTTGFAHYDFGIRHHEVKGAGMLPLFAYWRGPFQALFAADFINGVAVLNRLLNHAATYTSGSSLSDVLGEPFIAAPPRLAEERLTLQVGSETRAFEGGAAAWSWYRGTTVGPYARFSALQALERFCDRLIVEVEVPVSRVVELLLIGCDNEAMLGLIVGLLVRHLEKADRLIDPFLVQPQVWRREINRHVSEHSGLAATSEGLVNADRRNWMFSDVVMRLALFADEDRQRELLVLGSTLVDNEQQALQARAAASTNPGEPVQDDEGWMAQHLASVRRWATMFDRANYTAREHESGGILIEAVPPPEVTLPLEEGNRDLRRGQEALRLVNRYHNRPRNGEPENLTADEIATDLVVAQDLLTDPPQMSTNPWDGAAAVAFTALKSNLLNGMTIPQTGLQFAVEVIVHVGQRTDPATGNEPDGSYFQQGAARSAARALPLLLRPDAEPFHDLLEGANTDERQARIGHAIWNLARAHVDEIRLYLALGMDHLWCTACTDSDCHHEEGLFIATEMMRDCAMGDWDPAQQQRQILMLDDPVIPALAQVEDKRLLINRFDAAIRCLGPGTRSCVSVQARELLAALLTAQQRTLLAEKQYDTRGTHTMVSARALLTLAGNDDTELLYRHIDGYADASDRLRSLLEALSAAAEENETLAAAARAVWPNVISHVLALADAGHTCFQQDRSWSSALPALLPNPASDSQYLYRETNGAPIRWWEPLTLEAEVDAWLIPAAQQAVAVDHFIAFIGGLTLDEQLTFGLPRVAALIAANASGIARRSHRVADWLITLWPLAEAANMLATWQPAVDALVVNGVTRLAPYSD